jgi:hypothetical protein
MDAEEHDHEPEHGHVHAPPQEGEGLLRLEARPRRLIAARYERLPFPHLGPVQEIAFDLGITALSVPLTLAGAAFRGYHGHQLLFEQRWTAAVIRRHVGDEDLAIAAGTGLALRSLHFMLHAHEELSFIESFVVARRQDTGEQVQGRLQTPIVYHQQQTDLHLPVRGAWWVIQAGDWSDRHKSEVFSQPYALDFVKLGPDNAFFSNGGRALEDHASWDQPVYAAAGGKVAYVCYDMPDMAPGEMPDPRMLRGDPRRMLGNAVAVSHANGEFSYFAHLQQASLAVNEGQIIRRGTQIARVGNSGQSPGPHLHFALMEGPHLFLDQGLPPRFSHFWAGGAFYEEPVSLPARMIVSADA